jgi:hypothetical protein
VSNVQVEKGNLLMKRMDRGGLGKIQAEMKR